MIDKLIYNGKPFFDSLEVFVEIIERVKLIEGNIEHEQKLYPGPKTELIWGVFDALPLVDKFILIVGCGPDTVGSCAIVLNDNDISEKDFRVFETMVYNTVPINVFLRCFVFSADDFNQVHGQKGVGYQKVLPAL